MKWTNILVITVLWILLVSINVHAYERQTHTDLSQAALQASVLNQTSVGILTDLGLPESINVAEQFTNSNGVPRSIAELFGDGAQFEDNGIRPRNHFYNPLNNTPLTIPGIPLLNFTSPDWALEDNGQITGVLGIGSQDFSFADARGYLLKALTSSSESDRQKNFGLTFQTLGQVIHHIQDMAQPQHVRNDPHWDQFSLLGLNPLFNPSSYEKWTDRDTVRGALPFSGYAPTYSAADRTTFNVARNLWHTPDGKGLADFTNRNFVSARTNFDRPGLFPSPVLDQSKKSDANDIQQLCLNANPPCPTGLTGWMTFFGNTVNDNFLGPNADRENPRASTYSTFDQDLIDRGGTPVFSLNRFNFQAAQDFLIPRAVAYSAGMINYFFRGKIDLVPDDSNPGTFLIKNLGSEPMSGTFSLYYDYDDANAGTVNNRQLLISWDRSIPANDQVNIGTISDPINPAPKNPGEYMLVFKGNMGAETTAEFGAVVGKLVSSSILIFAAERYDAPGNPGDSDVELHLFIPENLTQKFLLNPAAISVQVGGLILPPMSVGEPCSPPRLPCVRLTGGNPLGGSGDAELSITQNNAFVGLVFTTSGWIQVFSGNTPEDLRLIPRETLCAYYIAGTSLVVGGYEPLSFVQVRFFFEGKVLFEFVVSPPAADNSVVLTNAKGVRLTDVNCRVGIQ